MSVGELWLTRGHHYDQKLHTSQRVHVSRCCTGDSVTSSIDLTSLPLQLQKKFTIIVYKYITIHK